MTSSLVNLSTGPVGITPEVQDALWAPLISHRSVSFRDLFEETTRFLCRAFNVRDAYLLTGSGTLANDAMLQEISAVSGRGLVLANGEFGERLIGQAGRNGLDFLTYDLPWGEPFDFQVIEHYLEDNDLGWLLCCHGETSTGMVMNLDRLTALADRYDCLCFVDCMSTVGTMPLDLSRVAMATASSGKGLASVPGLAIVLSNISPAVKPACPVYLDLSHYAMNGGIPFTFPSNLLMALHVAARQKFQDGQFELISRYRKKFFSCMNDLSLVPFGNEDSSVFTIEAPKAALPLLLNHFRKCGIEVSHQSGYLEKRGWIQAATFGFYTEAQLEQATEALQEVGAVLENALQEVSTGFNGS